MYTLLEKKEWLYIFKENRFHKDKTCKATGINRVTVHKWERSNDVHRFIDSYRACTFKEALDRIKSDVFDENQKPPSVTPKNKGPVIDRNSGIKKDFIKIPCIYFDEIMKDLTGNETKIVNCIFREINLFKGPFNDDNINPYIKYYKRPSNALITTARFIKMTGMSKGAVESAVKSLVSKNIIEKDKLVILDGYCLNTFSIKMNLELDDAFEKLN